ncbi:hypothetical protein YC2023_016934 [Brassica napus]
MKKFYGWSRWYLNRGSSEFEYVLSLSGFEMHRFVLREDLHIRSRLSDSSSAMALGLLQILVIKKK